MGPLPRLRRPLWPRPRVLLPDAVLRVLVCEFGGEDDTEGGAPRWKVGPCREDRVLRCKQFAPCDRHWPGTARSAE